MLTADMSSDKDHRSHGRSNVFLAAALDTGAASMPVRIRNISRRGALVEGAAFPPIGAGVRLVRGGLVAPGRLAWQGERHAGLNFDEEIDVESWVRRTGHSGQQRVDKIVAAIRSAEPVDAGDQVPRPGSLTALSAALDEQCERFASSDSFPLEPGEDLIRLDVIAQSLREIAGRGG